MANHKATLTKLVKTSKGWRFCPVILHKNGKVKAVLVHGEEHTPDHTSGQYHIRTYIGSKMQYRAVGNGPVEAVRQWRLAQLANDNPDLEIQSGVREGEKTLAQLGKEFLGLKALEPHRSRDAGDLYRAMIEEFTPALRLYEAQLLEIRAVVCGEIAEKIAGREISAAARHARKRKWLEARLQNEEG
ncbi:MAG: hypothetical protein CXZ00_05240 [Acidobacteria bacterium]|nr:MAG: hypothetical protein CXZ00_05240 [Acidobacteriota bacterium]